MSALEKKPLPSRGYGYQFFAFISFLIAGLALLALGGVGVLALLDILSGASVGALGTIPTLSAPLVIPSYAPIVLGAGVGASYALGKGAELMHERAVDNYRAAATGQEVADRMAPLLERSRMVSAHSTNFHSAANHNAASSPSFVDRYASQSKVTARRI